MNIDFPRADAVPRLRLLWKQVFGDTEAFLDLFFGVAYAPARCRVATEGETLAAMVYWFDCEFEGRKIAYLYAVATAPAFRRRGICGALLADTHALLKGQGYAGAILVPSEAGLFGFYGKLGYETCACVTEFDCLAGETATPLKEVDARGYARLRREYLPRGGVIQEGENLALQAGLGSFYGGPGFVAAAVREGETLAFCELLGDAAQAPGILKALGLKRGHFRVPGGETAFAMYCGFTGKEVPLYFGLAFD